MKAMYIQAPIDIEIISGISGIRIFKIVKKTDEGIKTFPITDHGNNANKEIPK